MLQLGLFADPIVLTLLAAGTLTVMIQRAAAFIVSPTLPTPPVTPEPVGAHDLV